MRNFIQKALKKLSKLDQEQIRTLIHDIASENELLEVVLDSMMDGVIVADKDNRVILVNKAAERMLPLRYADIYDRIIWEILNDDEIAQFIRFYLVNNERISDKEFTLDIGGRPQILSCSILPLVRYGKIRGNIFHIKNITEKKSREARLRRAESLASLTTLAAGVAHEIKNPLGSIGIHIQLIQKALQKESFEKDTIEHYLDIVNEEIDRLNKIVVDFLFAVKPMDTKLEEADLNAIIRELLDFLKFEFEQERVQVVENLSPDIPYLLLDAKYIKQALLNIIKNALSAMQGGGTLTVATKKQGDEVLLSIADTGTGIQEDILEKIFEPYFTTKEFGSGLGLTLVYKIVKEHMAEISLESKVNQGTTFFISFPIPQKEKMLIGWKGDERDV